MIMSEIEFRNLLIAQRTQSQAEVDRRTREHDALDLTPAERLEGMEVAR